jgi:hypothetical protein
MVGWTTLAVGATIITRHAGGASADRAILGVFGPFVLPLLAYGIVAATFNGQRVGTAGAPLRAYGADGGQVAMMSAVVAMAATALLGAILAPALVLLGHGPFDPPLAHDALTSAWIGALAGAAYASFFTLGACFGAKGGGRGAFLFVNWVFGAGKGASALIVPYGHVRSLLGGDPVLALSQRGSAIALAAVALVALALVSWRGRR